MKGRFKLSTPAKSRKVAKGQRTIIKITTFLRPGIGFYRTEQCLWVYVSYLSMGFLDTGIKKHQEHRQENLLLLSKVHGDCVTSHGLTAYHLFLGSYFEATLTTGMTGGTDTYDLVLNSSSRDIYLSLSEICQHQQQLEHLSGICRFFEEKFG